MLDVTFIVIIYSDVTIIEIEIFHKNQTESMSQFFEQM